MKRIVERVYSVSRLGFGRMYVVEAADGLALIDTSSRPDTPRRLIPQFRQFGFRLEAIKHILITHAHLDHVGSLDEFQRMTPARTYAHRREAMVIRGEQPVQYATPADLHGINKLLTAVPLPAYVPVARVDVELKGGETLDAVLPGLCVILTPGHTVGHTSYYWPEKRLLFGGDVVLHLPWGLSLPYQPAGYSLEETRRSVRKVAEMDIDVLCLGHGQPLVGGAAAKLRILAAKLPPEPIAT
jgi:glyoxylase-like metal-dependent hydrolase (beta-lactamase superfamily II)